MPYETKVDHGDLDRRIAATWTADVMARRRDPNSHPPTVSNVITEINTDNVNKQLQVRLAAGHENPVHVSSGGQDEWPVVCPVRIDVSRVFGRYEHDTAGPAQGMMGHIIDMDFYTKQSRVKIKMYSDPNALAIEVNDEEVYRWIEDNTDVVIKLPEFLERQSQEMGSWIEQVELQPGDEVVDGADGELTIIRTELQKEETDDALRYFGADPDDDPIIEEDDDPVLEPDDDDLDWE